jgi:uncharacterized protein YegL
VSGPSGSSLRNRLPLDDPPPAYAEAARSNRSSESDDRHAFLRTFDTGKQTLTLTIDKHLQCPVFLLDDSGSMRGRSWRETKEALAAIAPICTKYDADGVDIYFLNELEVFTNVTTVARVNQIFNRVIPRGGTPMGMRLQSILKSYLERYQARPSQTKPLNLIVITDGEPGDDDESPIIQTARRLDKLDAPAWQVGIQFFQVGNEPGARRHLKELDDQLSHFAGGYIRDMVDTVPYKDGDAVINADGILKVVLGAVNRRLDRSRENLHSPRFMGPAELLA